MSCSNYALTSLPKQHHFALHHGRVVPNKGYSHFYALDLQSKPALSPDSGARTVFHVCILSWSTSTCAEQSLMPLHPCSL